MSLKSLNQKGVTAVERLLIVLIVAVIAGTGYYVYNANKNANDTLNNAAKSSSSTPDIDKTATKAKANTGASEATASYSACLKAKDSTSDTSTYPPTCTTKEKIVFTPSDPSNFPKVNEKITIANPDKNVCSGAAPNASSSATLKNLTYEFAQVQLVPNCGDSLELIYSKSKGNWSVINTSHQSICFHTDYTSDVFTKHPTLKPAASIWCQ